MSEELIDRVLASDEVADLLASTFDFDVRSRAPEAVWFVVTDCSRLVPVGADAAGGIFVLCEWSSLEPAVIYVSSEGQAGVLARSLYDALGLIVYVPYWRDLAKFSGGGQVQEMRRVRPYLARELLEDEPDIHRLQARLVDFLGLEPLGDPAAVLHENITSGERSVVVTSHDGDPCRSLFNTFVVEDNPTWRERP